MGEGETYILDEMNTWFWEELDEFFWCGSYGIGFPEIFDLDVVERDQLIEFFEGTGSGDGIKWFGGIFRGFLFLLFEGEFGTLWTTMFGFWSIVCFFGIECILFFQIFFKFISFTAIIFNEMLWYFEGIIPYPDHLHSLYII